MKNFYDLQQFLKRFGIIIYTRDRIADLELMEIEIKELYHSNLIPIEEFQKGILLVRHEIQKEKDKRK